MTSLIKKLKNLNSHEKMLIALLIISIVLVASSWDRISDKAVKVFKLYTNNQVDTKE